MADRLQRLALATVVLGGERIDRCVDGLLDQLDSHLRIWQPQCGARARDIVTGATAKGEVAVAYYSKVRHPNAHKQRS